MTIEQQMAESALENLRQRARQIIIPTTYTREGSRVHTHRYVDADGETVLEDVTLWAD